MFAVILETGSIVLAAVLGDLLLNEMEGSPWTKALSDNCTHGIVALLSWLTVLRAGRTQVGSVSNSSLFEVLLCGFLGSLIDVDHFVEARSFDWKLVLHLSRRPVLHSSGLCSLLFVFCFLLSLILHSEFVYRLGWLWWVAFVSHHLRDATRRGIWFFSNWSTPPIPRPLYLASLAGLPHVTSFVMVITQHWFGGRLKGGFIAVHMDQFV